MDQHPIQGGGGVAILLSALCYKNRVKLRQCGLPLACVRLYLFTYHRRFSKKCLIFERTGQLSSGCACLLWPVCDVIFTFTVFQYINL